MGILSSCAYPFLKICISLGESWWIVERSLLSKCPACRMEALEIVHGRFTKTSQRNSIAGKVKHKNSHLVCSHKAPQFNTIKWIIYLPLGIAANVKMEGNISQLQELVLTSHLWDQSWLRVPPTLSVCKFSRCGILLDLWLGNKYPTS